MPTPTLPILAAVLLTACSGVKLDVVSPAADSTIGTPWIPVSVRLPEKWAGAQVRVLLDGADVTDPLALQRRRQDAAGAGLDWLATLDLLPCAPGPHQLQIELERPDGRKKTLTRDFKTFRPRAHVRLTVADGEEHVPSRVVVLGAKGNPHNLYAQGARAADPSSRDIFLSHLFAPKGEAEAWLPPGHYTFVATRGLRWSIDAREVDLVEGDQSIQLQIREVVPTPGQLGADLHLHTGRSADSYLPDRPRFWGILASGLEVFVQSDHNEIHDPTATLAALGATDIVGLPGVEARVGEKGTAHLTLFPLSAATPIPPGKPDWVPYHLDAWRARQKADPSPLTGDDLVIQLNHPRGIQFRPSKATQPWTHALFTRRGFRLDQPPGEGRNAWMTKARPESGTTALGFDAMELMNRFSYDVWRTVRKDWFTLMNFGYFHTATGNTDSHSMAVDTLGMPTTLVNVGEGPFDARSFVRAIKAGRATVSTGPVVDLVVTAGTATGTPGDLVTGPTAVARVTVRAAAWVPVPEVRLVQDGEVVRTVQPTPEDRRADGVLERTWEWPLDGTADTWVLAEAGWPLDDANPFPPAVPGLYPRIAPGAAPVGFTNPVRVDRDADGSFQPLRKTVFAASADEIPVPAAEDDAEEDAE